MNIDPQDIDTLDTLQAKQNNGRGITCVKDIISFLRNNDFPQAFAIRQWDGDKTRLYPEVENQLLKIFGCRNHAIRNCNNPFCEK